MVQPFLVNEVVMVLRLPVNLCIVQQYEVISPIASVDVGI